MRGGSLCDFSKITAVQNLSEYMFRALVIELRIFSMGDLYIKKKNLIRKIFYFEASLGYIFFNIFRPKL